MFPFQSSTDLFRIEGLDPPPDLGYPPPHRHRGSAQTCPIWALQPQELQTLQGRTWRFGGPHERWGSPRCSTALTAWWHGSPRARVTPPRVPARAPATASPSAWHSAGYSFWGKAVYIAGGKKWCFFLKKKTINGPLTAGGPFPAFRPYKAGVLGGPPRLCPTALQSKGPLCPSRGALSPQPLPVPWGKSPAGPTATALGGESAHPAPQPWPGRACWQFCRGRTLQCLQKTKTCILGIQGKRQGDSHRNPGPSLGMSHACSSPAEWLGAPEICRFPFMTCK